MQGINLERVKRSSRPPAAARDVAGGVTTAEASPRSIGSAPRRRSGWRSTPAARARRRDRRAAHLRPPGRPVADARVRRSRCRAGLAYSDARAWLRRNRDAPRGVPLAQARPLGQGRDLRRDAEYPARRRPTAIATALRFTVRQQRRGLLPAEDTYTCFGSGARPRGAGATRSPTRKAVGPGGLVLGAALLAERGAARASKISRGGARAFFWRRRGKHTIRGGGRRAVLHAREAHARRHRARGGGGRSWIAARSKVTRRGRAGRAGRRG